jgi:transketolase C-terminal domain/subunit
VRFFDFAQPIDNACISASEQRNNSAVTAKEQRENSGLNSAVTAGRSATFPQQSDDLGYENI